MEQAAELDARRHADDLRQTWQGRVLAGAQGRMMLTVPSILAHSYDDAMPVLLRVVEPPCWDAGRCSLRAPFLCSAAKIDKRGCLIADMIIEGLGIPVRDVVIFRDVGDFERDLRKLADRLKFADRDRIEFFVAATRWVVADRRLDPAMDPRDPDARRLTVH